MHECGRSAPSPRTGSAKEPNVPNFQNISYQRRGTGPGNGLASECVTIAEIVWVNERFIFLLQKNKTRSNKSKWKMTFPFQQRYQPPSENCVCTCKGMAIKRNNKPALSNLSRIYCPRSM